MLYRYSEMVSDTGVPKFQRFPRELTRRASYKPTSTRRQGGTPWAAAGLPPDSRTPSWCASRAWVAPQGFCGHQGVKGRVNPATRGGFKTSHFEEKVVCGRDNLRSTELRFREVRYGKPTQDGCGRYDSDVAWAGLVPAADRVGTGDRPGDRGSLRPFVAGGGKTSHEPAHRVGGPRAARGGRKSRPGEPL
jgi:hypothetical protein